MRNKTDPPSLFDLNFEKEKLKELNRTCKQQRIKAKQVIKDITQLRKENEEFERRLLALRNHELDLAMAKDVYQKNVDEIKQKGLIKNCTLNLISNSAVLGYKFLADSWDKEHQVEIIKCCYNENCYIKLAVRRNGTKELLEIVPNHPNFSNISKYLQMNQDAAGLLAKMMEYFEHTIYD